MRLIKTERGIRVETLLGVAGAVSGFAAQNATWATVRRRQGEKLPPNSIAVVTTKSGETFYFGELLNSYLYPQQESKFPTLFVFAAGAAKSLGVELNTLPPVVDMFAYVTRCIGTPEFGYPRVATEHRPGLTVSQSVKAFWPVVRRIFQLPIPDTAGAEAQKEPPLDEEHWPLMLG